MTRLCILRIVILRMKKGFSLLPLIIIVAVFAVVVAAVAYYSASTRVPSKAENRVIGTFPTRTSSQPVGSQAEVKTADVIVSGDVEEGEQSVPVTVKFSNSEDTISGVALRLVYQGEESDGLSATGLKINSNFVNSGNWVCPIKTAKTEGGQVVVDLACVNISPEGYAPQNQTEMATFNLTRTSGNFMSPVQMEIDPNMSAITRKSDGKNVLNTSGSLTAN